MPKWPLTLRRAEAADMAAIVGLIDEASEWLKTKDTDQWATPWPTLRGRNSRIEHSLRQRKTWIAWDGETPAATLTADPEHDPYWAQPPWAETALYVHRLVVARAYAGVHLGTSLLDWAGWTGRRQYDARWVRISAWTTNLRLHAYYRSQGFRREGTHPDDGYPSSARFGKPTATITRTWPPLVTAPDRFTES